MRRSFSTVHLTVLIAAAAGGLSCKARQIPAAASDVRVVGGEQAAAGRFPASVHIPRCSAARIGPRHLLTAAHCVMTADAWALDEPFKRGARFKIDYGPVLAAAETYDVEVASTRVHPSYKQSKKYGGDSEQNEVVDIAVIEVRSLPPSIATARLADVPLQSDEPVTFTGYGCESLPDHMRVDDGSGGLGGTVVKDHLGEAELALRLKFKTLPLFALDGTAGFLHNLREDPLAHGAEPQEVFSGCPGDSGSAAYLDTNPPQLTIVGVNSFVGPFMSAFMRLDDAGPYRVGACLAQALNAATAPVLDGIGSLCAE
jgi:hypothetical protein